MFHEKDKSTNQTVKRHVSTSGSRKENIGIYTEKICLVIIKFRRCLLSLLKWTDDVIEMPFVCIQVRSGVD